MRTLFTLISGIKLGHLNVCLFLSSTYNQIKLKKSAIILGATGLTGGYVLDQLLNNPEYSKIIVFSRRKLETYNEKLHVFECDLLNLEEQKEYFKADEVYVCIGTTNNKTPNKKLIDPEKTPS